MTERTYGIEYSNTHGVLVGYLLWFFGFLGAHRFFYGKKISGTIYFFTFGFFLIGWVLDLFFMPSLARSARRRYAEGPYRYDLAWLLLTYLGPLGAHRFYTGRILSGLVYFLTFGVFGLGVLYDYWTLNEQVDELNLQY